MPATETSRKYLNQERAVELIAAWRASGMSLASYAQSQGVSEPTLARWLRRLNATPEPREITPAFVQIQPMDQGDITVHAHGISIQVPAPLLEQSLSTILRALRC
jgi:lambda repressor-like predicted transcriptional regulator